MAIIFIPGIKATALANINSFDYKLVYENYDTLGGAIGSTIMGIRLDESLQLNPLYDQTMSTILERNHIMTYPYKNSIIDIESYTKDNVYLFGYDWRKSNIENANELAKFVSYLKGKLRLDKFSFITHSMGAMIMTCYLKTLPAPYSTIDKIVFTAPPFRGGMEALKHMAMGSGGIRGFFNLDEGSRKAIRTYPALYELIPWYNGAIKGETGENLDLSIKSNWQTSIYDDDYMKDIFPARVQSMVDFRNTHFMDLNALTDELKARCLVVAGTGSDTLKSVSLVDDTDNTKYFDFQNAEETDEGDSTVPLTSSTIYSNSIQTIVVKKGNFFQEGMTSVSYHALFLTHSKVLNVVKRFLKNQTSQANWYESVGKEKDVTLI